MEDDPLIGQLGYLSYVYQERACIVLWHKKPELNMSLLKLDHGNSHIHSFRRRHSETYLSHF